MIALPTTGEVIADRYRLGPEIGRGGMGVVFEADNLAVGSKVAIKFLHPEALDDADQVVRFRREARATACIPHPNVVYVFDLGLWGAAGLPFIVMELLHGQPLSSVLRFEGPVAPDVAITIATQLLDALVAAHERGVIHRDLKPSNVFLLGSRREQVKVLDFGISKLLPDSDQLTKLGHVMGTPAYMPPEQAMGLSVDHRVDLYGTGAVLYESLTGRPPYDDEQPIAVIGKMLSGTPPPTLQSLLPDIDPGLAAVIHKALERRPEERWPSALEMRTALVAATGGTRTTARSPVRTRAPLGPHAHITLTDSILLAPFPHTEPLDPPSGAEAAVTNPRTRIPPPRPPRSASILRRRTPIAAFLSLVPLVIGGGALLLGGEPEASPSLPAVVAVAPVASVVTEAATTPTPPPPPPAMMPVPDAVLTEPLEPAPEEARPARASGRTTRRRLTHREAARTKVLEPNPFR